MSEVVSTLSATAVRALLRQESEAYANIKMLMERKRKLSGVEAAWSIQREREYIERRLKRGLARLNEINAIFVKYGCRSED